MRRRHTLVLFIGALLLAACGGGAALATTTPAASTATPATSAQATPSAATTTAPSTGVATWTITSASKGTVSVREQLVGVNLPSDAVLVATGATGSFTVNADGTFSRDSKITFDLTTLASDQRGFVKMDTLAVRQFPTATFVPTKATGLALPLAANAEATFTLAGKMTIHGVTKDVTFDVVTKRNGAQLTATATANPTWKFEDFGMKAPSVPFRVVSVVDEIRLVVEIVASGSAA